MPPIQRRSVKRDAILAALKCTACHPDAEWIYQQLKESYPDLSLATVYRNLSQLKAQGLISSLGDVGGVERFDGNPMPHVHFVCQCCGQVQDLPGLQLPEELPAAAAQALGAHIQHYQLIFSGRCRDCPSGREAS